MSNPNTKRGFGSVGLIIVILIIIAGGSYMWSQKGPTDGSPTAVTTDSANWKTYRNEEYGFEFKYPADFEIEDRSYKSNQGVAIKDVLVCAPNGGQCLVFASTLDDPNLSLQSRLLIDDLDQKTRDIVTSIRNSLD
ncbi:MAG: PsbP-related protein [Patescibacteria group bacterium]